MGLAGGVRSLERCRSEIFHRRALPETFRPRDFRVSSPLQGQLRVFAYNSSSLEYSAPAPCPSSLAMSSTQATSSLSPPPRSEIFHRRALPETLRQKGTPKVASRGRRSLFSKSHRKIRNTSHSSSPPLPHPSSSSFRRPQGAPESMMAVVVVVRFTQDIK